MGIDLLKDLLPHHYLLDIPYPTHKAKPSVASTPTDPPKANSTVNTATIT